MVKFITFIAYSIFVVLLASTALASQETQVKQANDLFKKQQWDDAIDHYLNALEESSKDADIVQYDLGSAFYKKGDFDQSIEHYQKSISDKNKVLSANAYFNLGNALYKKGHSLEKSKIDDAISSLQKSLENYQQTLNLTPKDEDAKYNYDFVEKELERLKKKKQEQQKRDQQHKQHRQSPKKPQSKKEDQEKQKHQQKNQEDQQRKNPNQENKEHNQQNQNAANQQNQSSSETKPPESKPPENKNPEGQPQGNQNTPQASSSSETDASMGQEEVSDLLDEYQKDAPKGLLNFTDRHQERNHVDKDW